MSDEEQEGRSWLKYLPTILTIVGIIAAVVLALFFKKLFFKEDVQQKKVIQQITVITPPPPPPPPPEKPPEPEVEEEVIEEEPEPTPDDTPDESVSEDLGLDAEGEAGSDAFGLVGKKGGRGLLGGGGYGAYIKSEINKAIIKDKDLRQLAYKAKITVWVETDGSFIRYNVDILEGDQAAKQSLERFLGKMGGVSRSKPFEEDSWFSFRVTSVI